MLIIDSIYLSPHLILIAVSLLVLRRLNSFLCRMRQFVENVFAAVETDIAVGAVMFSNHQFSGAKYTAADRPAKAAKDDKHDVLQHANC